MKNTDDSTAPSTQQDDIYEEQPAEEEFCLFCGINLTDSEIYYRFRVCPDCRFHHHLPARQRIDLLADPGSFKEVNRFLTSIDPLSFSGKEPYDERIHEAQQRTGLTEAVMTGVCTIGGNPTIISVLDFGFLGGNMGGVVGEKVALAFELAIKRKMPVVTIVSSGGSRVQEGVLSLMQMAKTAAAAKKLHSQRLPHVSVLTNPTSGEVYASFANLGDVILAEPKALIGFAPLRVIQETSEKPLPEGSHTAEDHLKHGMIDQVVDRTKLRQSLSILLDLLSSRYRLTVTKRKKPYPVTEHLGEQAWDTVQLARHRQRPTAWDYISRITTSFIEIRGDRHYGDDRAVICGIAELSGEAVVIIGQERSHNEGRAYPEGFRKAQRAMRLAAIFGMPIITLIDTPGAYPGLDAEERGIGPAIASTLALMSDLPTPIVSIIIGEGGSEGALALGFADRIVMQENAIYSVISPEGAASIIYRDADKAKEIASALKLTAMDCKDLGVIDTVAPEPEGGAHVDLDEAARLLKNTIVRELLEAQQFTPAKLVRNRYKKFRRMGEYSSYFRAAISKEVSNLQELLQRGVSIIRQRIAASEKEENHLEMGKTG
ncbi:MAG: acetyl-CoA carboxylase carboxyl transferase subunit beta [Dehalococcoidia bacterium]|nr:MAG: acetyl-CoA carboxylase carboxyl transferase subunit beta [Dehalococcoidia bacterium]